MSLHQRPILFTPKLRQRVRMEGVVGAAGMGLCPWNDCDGFTGGYGASWCESDGIHFGWGFAGAPPFAHTSLVVAGAMEEGRFTWDVHGRLHLLYTSVGVGVLECVSNDDGKTWGDGVVEFTGGTHPHVFRMTEGTLIWSAYVSGAIQGIIEEPGDDPGSPFTFKDDSAVDLAVADDQYCITQQASGPALLLLHVTIDGETDTSNWWSSDKGARWKRYT